MYGQSARTFVVAAVLLSVMAVVQTASASPQPCVQSWGEAAEIVSGEKLVTVEALTQMARDALAGEVVRTALCRENGRYIYKIVVRQAGGGLRHLEVDARRPFAPPVANR
jgi:uncharacterized membrane protein YkoI